MSKNSKNARRNKEAKERSQARQGGSRGPSNGQRAASPQHKKKRAWWQLFRSYSDYIKGGGKTAKGVKRQAEADNETVDPTVIPA